MRSATVDGAVCITTLHMKVVSSSPAELNVATPRCSGLFNMKIFICEAMVPF